MLQKQLNKCPSCGKRAHDYEKEEALACVPPRNTLKFGQYQINKEYREALFKEFPFYNAEEVMGSFFGENPFFPSENEWLNEQTDVHGDEEEP